MIYLLLVYFAVRVFGEVHDFVTGCLYSCCTSYLLCGNSHIHDPSNRNFLHKFLQYDQGCGLVSAQSQAHPALFSSLLAEWRQDFARNRNNGRFRKKHRFRIQNGRNGKESLAVHQQGNLDIKGCNQLTCLAHTHHISGLQFHPHGLCNNLYPS